MASPLGGSPIDIGLIARAAGTAVVRANLANQVAGPKRLIPEGQTFFGPGQTIAPAAQEETHGRQWDFPTNINTQYRPRGGEAVDFPTLRALADNYDLVRLAIETRKDQMGKLRWGVTRKSTGQQDDTAKKIEEFLQEPDGEHDFLDWSRMLYEELLVIDAATVYIRPNLGGGPYALELIDGATIKRVIDDRGRTPAPPAEGQAFNKDIHTAYQQIIKGLPATDYHADELIYKPRNPRVNKLYGFSPVEQIMMIVNIGLRRESHQLAFYTAGNIPEMLMATPATWNPDQIKTFQKLWDEMLQGDLEARRKLKFVPGDVKPLPLRPESSLFDMFDEWVARVVFYCFSLPPTGFVKQQNRATAESAQEAAIEEGLSPLMEWKVRFMNRIIRKGWKTTDYEFGWLDEQDIDPLVQAQIDQIYVDSGIRLPNEVRDDHNWEPKPELDEKKLAPPPPAPGTVPPKTDDATDPKAAQQPGGKKNAEKLLKRRSQRQARRSY